MLQSLVHVFGDRVQAARESRGRRVRQLTSVMFDDLDDDMEPEAWPALEQRKLDESLRCAICGDLFGMPVSFATCTHTCAFPRSASPPPVSVISYPTSFAIISIYQYSLTGIPPTAAQTVRCASGARLSLRRSAQPAAPPGTSPTCARTTLSRLLSERTRPRGRSFWRVLESRARQGRPSPPHRPRRRARGEGPTDRGEVRVLRVRRRRRSLRPRLPGGRPTAAKSVATAAVRTKGLNSISEL